MNFIHENNRIYSSDEQGNITSEVTYPKVSEQTVVIDHTFVDSSLRGQGIAGKLMEETVAELRKSGRKARLSCSYAVRWFEEHPEYSDILDK